MAEKEEYYRVFDLVFGYSLNYIMLTSSLRFDIIKVKKDDGLTPMKQFTVEAVGHRLFIEVYLKIVFLLKFI
ncbi:hypothetical protein SuUB85_11420 [Streptococcus uberis]